MEQILNKLSEIELTAQRIMEDCDRQKQQLSEEAEQKCKNYDEQLETRTAEQIRRIRQQLEEEKDSRLAQLRADTDATFSSLDAHYEQQHSQLSRELFETFRPVHSDLQTSEWYSYFENDVLDNIRKGSEKQWEAYSPTADFPRKSAQCRAGLLPWISSRKSSNSPMSRR